MFHYLLLHNNTNLACTASSQHAERISNSYLGNGQLYASLMLRIDGYAELRMPVTTRWFGHASVPLGYFNNLFFLHVEGDRGLAHRTSTGNQTEVVDQMLSQCRNIQQQSVTTVLLSRPTSLPYSPVNPRDLLRAPTASNVQMRRDRGGSILLYDRVLEIIHLMPAGTNI